MVCGVHHLLEKSFDQIRVFLVELLVCGVLALFFLFYFNRLFATLVSYGLRAYTWHKFRIYIDIQALQISLLGGRIFFKGVRYHGENETIFVHNGFVTWSYWLHSVKQVDTRRFGKSPPATLKSVDEEFTKKAEDADAEAGGLEEARDLQCRISVSVSGLEWFVYNRSPAYDTIVAHDPFLQHVSKNEAKLGVSAASESFVHQQAKTTRIRQSPRKRSHASEASESTSASVADESLAVSEDAKVHHNIIGGYPTADRKSTQTSETDTPQSASSASTSALLRALPVWLECHKGAIVLGNGTTRALLTTTFDRAKGLVDAGTSGPQDLFRQIIDFEIEHPVVQMRPNPDFRQSQQASAEHIIFGPISSQSVKRWWTINWHLHQQRRRKAWSSLRNLVPHFRRSVESFRQAPTNEQNDTVGGSWTDGGPHESQWLGLTRYLDDNERDDHEGWMNVEYARFSNILDCPSVHFTFYWDVPGQVQEQTMSSAGAQPCKDINGTSPPAYGLDIAIRGGNIHYGPWTDRLRAEIQNAFFPIAYTDSKPAQHLLPGDSRQSTTMKIRIDIEEEVSLRVPTRESSKDWQWKGRAGALRGTSQLQKHRDRRYLRHKKRQKSTLGPDIRPFGWLSFHVEANSTVTYEMDVVSRGSGYSNYLDLDLKGTKATSSVNHDTLWRCGPQRLACDLSVPLGWNTLHVWTFTIRSHSLELFMLRDHMFLLTDLINDFTVGPGPDFMTFVPFEYQIKLQFTDLKLYLNVNDANIIDNPCDLKENVFVILNITQLTGKVNIPLHNYSPSQNKILFSGEGHDGHMDLVTPLWSTLRTFVGQSPVAMLKDFALEGSYNYFSTTSVRVTDTLLLNITGSSARVFLHGFLIRYFMQLKENYFGDDMHFKTLEEYQELLTSTEVAGAEDRQTHGKKDNDMDVILSVRADNSCALMPANLYSRKDNVRIDILLVEADMRFNNYYMDMVARFSPLSFSLESLTPEEIGAQNAVSNTQLFIDGISVYGHRLFGASPSEPTYVCNWDFDIGKITGECSTMFVRTLLFAVRAFAFTLDDKENALPVSHIAVIYDITFLRAQVESIAIWCIIDDNALLIGTEHIDLAFNDWAGSRFSERMHANIPKVNIASVDRQRAVRHRSGQESPITTHACFNTSVNVKMMNRKAKFVHNHMRQQQHVRFHDQRTHRTGWLLDHSKNAESQRPQAALKVNPPAMTVPLMPEPVVLTGTAHRFLHTRGVPRIHSKISRKSSFLSQHSLGLNEENVSQGKGSKQSGSSSQSPGAPPSSLSKSQFESEMQLPKPSLPFPNVKQERLPLERRQSGAKLTFSSAWASPYFSLQNVRPDTSDVPAIPEDLGQQKVSSRSQDVDDGSFLPLDEDPHSAHHSLLLDLSSGLVGFCTPRMFETISSLLVQLQPDHPVDLLDEVQIDTISKILDLAKLKNKARTVTDMSLRVPFIHVRTINVDTTNETGDGVQQRDQYDLIATQTGITLRLNSYTEHNGAEVAALRGLVFHLLAKEMRTVVSGQSDRTIHDKATTQGTLKDVGFWFVHQHETSAKLQLRSIELVTRGSQMEYTASLIHRTTAMIEHIVAGFTRTKLMHCVQHLVYYLTSEGTDIADPPFLTKPSYVLRTSDNHLRLNDSWKIISRLRYIYRRLPERTQENIVEKAKDPQSQAPKDAEAHVLSSLDKWRNWDLGEVKDSPIMDRIWGEAQSRSIGAAQQKDLRAELTVGSTRFLLDPGSRQNEVIVGDINVGVAVTAARASSSITLNESTEKPQLVMIQSYCSHFAVRLNLELTELIGNTLEQFAPAVNSSHPSQLPTNIDGDTERQFHVVFGTDSAMIAIDSFNLTLALGARDMRGSIILGSSSLHDETWGFLFSSTSATAGLQSHRQPTLGWRLSKTNLYGSFRESQDSFRGVNVLRLAGTCGRLRFDMIENVMGVMNIAQRALGNEVERVHQVVSKIQANDGLSRTAGSGKRPPPLDVHVAMFLDDYKLSFAILPALRYTISGKVVRTSVSPRHDSRIAIDFDMERQSHSFHSSGKERTITVSVLNIPPINGRVNITEADSKLIVEVESTFEKIELQAASVRSCVDVLNRPEVARLFADAKAAIVRIMDTVEDVFASSSPAPSIKQAPKTRTLHYSTYVTFAGLGIHARAPGIKTNEYSADFDLDLELSTMHVHNSTERKDAVYKQPQFNVNVRQISLELRRSSHNRSVNYGKLTIGFQASGVTERDEHDNQVQVYHASSREFVVDLYPETASLVVDVAAFLQERIKSFAFSEEAKQFRPIRRLTTAGLTDRPVIKITNEDEESEQTVSTTLLDSMYALEIHAIQIRWNVHDIKPATSSREAEDLLFTIKKIELGTKREGSARLVIADLQLQMVPKSANPAQRSSNSALLPEVIFNVAYLSSKPERRLAFQVAGKALDLRLASDFILPATVLRDSLGAASREIREANAFWTTGPVAAPNEKSNLLGSKRLASLLVDADFAGAVVNVQARKEERRKTVFGILKGSQRPRAGRYNQAVQGDSASQATLRAPGVAFKVEYRDSGQDDPLLGAEVKVAASSNVLNPSVVPLIIEISSSIKEIVGDAEASRDPQSKKVRQPSYLPDQSINNADPSAILGRCKLNVGLWIREQEFSLSCQPIARVAATARFDDIFMTVNTVQSPEHQRFFAVLLTFNKLQASVQHVYSRESTASLEVDSIVISMMNSKHVSTSTGISAILNISPMRTAINAKQLQDFLLFREIWYPAEIRQASSRSTPAAAGADTQAYVVQRYKEVAATGAFPWNAVISLQELSVQLDLGQSLGKSLFTVSKLWASTKKNSDWEQNLCIGFEKVGVESTGRMSGFIELQKFRVRTSIRWPLVEIAVSKAPLVQASLGLDNLRVKAAFDYQPFAVADISTFEFLMYNVRPTQQGEKDRLVGNLEGGKVQAFCTTASAAQVLALFQAFERLVQEKEAAYETSLKELDRYLRRKSVFPSSTWTAPTANASDSAKDSVDRPLTLHTDVIVTLGEVNLGVFPSTFFDNQILKVEATDAQARFAVSAEDGKTRSGLGLTLGQLRVALANVSRANTKALSEVSVEDVVSRATGAKGGTILKVPKVVVSMQTWQAVESNNVEYVFKSTFQGKVDVGWNYSRISFIRGMWRAHSRAFAHRLGKPLSQSALQISGGPLEDQPSGKNTGQEKITAVVNVPQSKFEYLALEPPIVETPQLRDMGEATPPLEWVGISPSKLPHVTHQVIIVNLLKIAKEVEYAYSEILGST